MSSLSGFRRLLRSAKFAFREDKFALSAATGQLKAEFRKHRAVSDPAELQQLLQGVGEVEEMLRFNIVQGKRNQRGNFEVALNEPEHQVTLSAGQDDPHGVDIAPIDQSVLGNPANVQVTKTKGSSKSKKST